MTSRFDVLIVGAGHAGSQAAIALRAHKFAGKVALLGDEPDLPYERPPLSKDYLAGTKPFDRILIRPRDFWPARAIELLPGRRVDHVDPAKHEVRTAEGETIGYGTLIWAAGGRARTLRCEGSDLAGVHTVRSRADADRMMAELEGIRRVVVIGGGYIGLEAAAVLTGLGKQVTLIESRDRVLARVAGEPLSRFYEAEHRARGVDVRLGVKLDRLEGEGSRVTGVRLADGELLPCEMAIVGIGIAPAVEPLFAAGAAGDDGVRVDVQCRTSLPDIFAIGDCALHASAFAEGKAIRLESVQNANDMADAVARTLCGTPARYVAVPWFWSNQYDLRLQTVGLSSGHDRVVLRGDPAKRSFSLVYLKQGSVIALDCVNAAKDYMQGRALVQIRAQRPDHVLADAGIPLNS